MSNDVAMAGVRKRCSTCQMVLDLEGFTVKQMNRDGTVIRYATCNKCRRLRVRIATPRLDAAPLARWMVRRLSAEGILDIKTWAPIPDHRAPRNIEEIARDWRTSAKRIQDILKGRVTTVAEDYADRVLTAAGSPHLLSILWDVDDADDVEDLAEGRQRDRMGNQS